MKEAIELLRATANAVLALYGDPPPPDAIEVAAVVERLNYLAAAMRVHKLAVAIEPLEQEPSEQEKQGG